jgi:cell division protein FtsQ
MARSRQGAKPEGSASSPASVPASSRLTFRGKRNRKHRSSLWSRLPPPRAIVDACGRAVRRAIPAAIATVALAAVGTGAWLGYRFVTTSSRFAITDITVRGNHRVPSPDVIAQLGFHAGDNIFTAGLESGLRARRADAWIASAEVHRELPHGIVIDVRERAPVAIVELGGLYLVDDTGHPFKKLAAEPDELPVITGLDRDAYRADPDGTAATVRDALAALGTWKADPQRPAIGEVHVGPHATLVLHTYDRATAIQLGALDPELPSRMHTFDVAWAGLAEAERARARAVHLDARTDHVTVALAE